MNRYLFALFLVMPVLHLQAQDVIMKMNGQELYAKVLEITDSVVIYKTADTFNTPVKFIRKQEVFFIRYANNTRDIITTLVDEQNSKAQIQLTRADSITNRNGAYFYKGRSIVYPELKHLLQLQGDPRCIDHVKKARNSLGRTLLGWGMAITIASGTLSSAGFVAWYVSKDGSYQNDDALAFGFLGLSGTFHGAALIFIGYEIGKNAKAHLEQAINIYNNNLHP